MFGAIYHLLKGLHILLAIVWVGGLLFVGWGVYPAARKLKFAEQRLFLFTLMKHCHWLFTLTGAGVIFTGILLGTTFGPIKHWRQIWDTTYGNIWVSALVIALFTLLWGVFVGYRRTIKVLSDDTIWQLAETGDAKPLYKALLITAAIESLEGLGFIALITCMILLP